MANTPKVAKNSLVSAPDSGRVTESQSNTKGALTMARKRGRGKRGTPERNALHVLFQEKSYCIAFIETACPGWMSSYSLDNIGVYPNAADQEEKQSVQAKKRLARAEQQLAEAQKAYAAKYFIERWLLSSRREVKKHQQKAIEAKQNVAEHQQKVMEAKQNVTEHQQNVNDTFKSFYAFRKSLRIECDCKPDLVGNEVDVKIFCNFTIVAPPGAERHAFWNRRIGSRFFYIQVEPSVADNYREILAQMKASRAKYLFLDTYEGRGATREQFETFFRSADITVVYKHSVDSTAARLSPP
jgi:hypothetical protein